MTQPPIPYQDLVDQIRTMTQAPVVALVLCDGDFDQRHIQIASGVAESELRPGLADVLRGLADELENPTVVDAEPLATVTPISGES